MLSCSRCRNSFTPRDEQWSTWLEWKHAGSCLELMFALLCYLLHHTCWIWKPGDVITSLQLCQRRNHMGMTVSARRPASTSSNSYNRGSFITPFLLNWQFLHSTWCDEELHGAIEQCFKELVQTIERLSLPRKLVRFFSSSSCCTMNAAAHEVNGDERKFAGSFAKYSASHNFHVNPAAELQYLVHRWIPWWSLPFLQHLEFQS